jgi:hypothetical protein
MPVESQAQVMPEYANFVENARFAKNGVLFVSLNIAGSNNGFETSDPQAAAEYFERNRANIAWIDDSFRKAKEEGASAAVLAFQANLYDVQRSFADIPPASGFFDTVNAIERNAKTFAKPVLAVHGDYHVLEISGLRNVRRQLIPNVFRLQIMGDTRVHAVRVIVDPDSPGVFGFVPLIIPEKRKFLA